MNLKKIILLLLLFISFKVSAQVVPVIPQWKMDTSKDSLSFSIPGMAGSKWVWDSRLLRVKLLNKADSVDWYVTHTALSDTLAGHLAVAGYGIIFVGDTIKVDTSVIHGGGGGAFLPLTLSADTTVNLNNHNLTFQLQTGNRLQMIQGDSEGSRLFSFSKPEFVVQYADTGEVKHNSFITQNSNGVNIQANNQTTGNGSITDVTATDTYTEYIDGGTGNRVILQTDATGTWQDDQINNKWMYYLRDLHTTDEPGPFEIPPVNWVYKEIREKIDSAMTGGFLPLSLSADTTVTSNGHVLRLGNAVVSSIPISTMKIFPDGTIDIGEPSSTSSRQATVNIALAAPGNSYLTAGGLDVRNDATVNINGLGLGYILSTTDHTVSSLDVVVDMDATSANKTVSLPDVSTLFLFPVLIIKKSDATAHTVTVNAFSGQTIDGASSVVLTNQYDYVVIQAGGNSIIHKWNVFSKNSTSGGSVTSVTGTTNRIASTGGTTPVIDISASYVGQSSITTVGTLSSGSIPYSLLTGTPVFVDSETPSGTINSSNVTFTLANTPVTGSVHLYRNGVRVTNFTVSTATITFSSAPLTGDSLIVDYRK